MTFISLFGREKQEDRKTGSQSGLDGDPPDCSLFERKPSPAGPPASAVAGSADGMKLSTLGR